MRNSFYLFFLLIILPSSLVSQSRQITLQDAIRIATDSSLASFKYKNYFLASYWEFNMYKANRKPGLNLTTTPVKYNRSLSQRYNSETNVDEFRPQQSLYSDVGLSISQNIGLTGGNIYLNSSLNRLQNYGENSSRQYSSIPVQIGYNQPLFGFNRLKWEKKIAPLKFEKAKKDLVKELETINENTNNLFFNYIIAQLQLDMAATNKANADTLYQTGEKRFNILTITQSELFTLKVQMLDAINIRDNAEKDLKKAKYAFDSYLRLYNNDQYELVLPELPTIAYIDPEEALKQAIQSNPDLLEQKQLVLEAQRNAEEARIKKGINSSLSASFGLNQSSVTIPDAYNDPLNQQQFMVTLSVPIVDWGVAKGNYNMARRNYEAVKISAEQVENDFKQNIYIAVSDYNMQAQIVKTVHEKREYAEKAYSISKQRFMLGKEDVNSMILTLSRQDNAKLEYIQAIYKYWSYYYALRKVTLYDFVNNTTLTQDIDNLLNE